MVLEIISSEQILFKEKSNRLPCREQKVRLQFLKIMHR